MSTPTLSRPVSWHISWELLPDDYVLMDEPVENILQPAIAAFLNEILELNGLIQPNTIIATNFAICATVDGKTIVKAPDWVWIPNVKPTENKQIRRSYTPQKEGDLPVIAMEFLSESDCGEYSMNPNYPYGKWWFYEQILAVPIYIIFQPQTGHLEVYFLVEGHYQKQEAITKNLYWLASMGLFLGVWEGTRLGNDGFWLRWWDAESRLLACGSEQIEQERSRNERLMAQLRSLGVEPDL